MPCIPHMPPVLSLLGPENNISAPLLYHGFLNIYFYYLNVLLLKRTGETYCGLDVSLCWSPSLLQRRALLWIHYYLQEHWEGEISVSNKTITNSTAVTSGKP